MSAHWDGTAETEEIIKKETKATIRCIPIDGVKEKVIVYIQKNLLNRKFYSPKHINFNLNKRIIIMLQVCDL